MPTHMPAVASATSSSLSRWDAMHVARRFPTCEKIFSHVWEVRARRVAPRHILVLVTLRRVVAATSMGCPPRASPSSCNVNSCILHRSFSKPASRAGAEYRKTAALPAAKRTMTSPEGQFMFTERQPLYRPLMGIKKAHAWNAERLTCALPDGLPSFF